MLPSQDLGERGRRQGPDTVVLANVPCSIETLSGRELEVARQLYATATARVELHGDPAAPLTPQHYLLFGTKKLHIGHVDDVDRLGVEYVLLCGEDR